MRTLHDSTITEPRIFLAADMEAPEEVAFLGGCACLYTHRSPDKDTDNEDAAALLPFDGESGLLVVADGVGGHMLGDRASALTIETLQASLAASAGRGEMLRTAVLNGIEQANRAVLDLNAGAATTLALVEVQGRSARPYHIGDSMICIVGQRGKVKLQTVSHSPVGFAVEAGVLDEKEAMHHEARHVVSNVVGSEDMRIEIGSSLRLADLDTIILGSDGLFDNLHVDEILDVVRKGPLLRGVSRLVEVARQRMREPGGDYPSKPDDLTVVAFRRRPSRRRGSR